MKRLLTATLAGMLLCGGLPCRPAAATDPTAAKTQAPLRLSRHAMERMTERGISPADVQWVVATRKPFRYYHHGSWKTGYYDPDRKLLIATADGIVITVITDASQDYVGRLKKAKP